MLLRISKISKQKLSLKIILKISIMQNFIDAKMFHSQDAIKLVELFHNKPC